MSARRSLSKGELVVRISIETGPFSDQSGAWGYKSILTAAPQVPQACGAFPTPLPKANVTAAWRRSSALPIARSVSSSGRYSVSPMPMPCNLSLSRPCLPNQPHARSRCRLAACVVSIRSCLILCPSRTNPLEDGHVWVAPNRLSWNRHRQSPC